MQKLTKTRNNYQKMSEELIIDAMADCVFPEDIMLCILTRLPVKSLVRFKSVCKPWRELFAHPQFIKMHYNQFSSCSNNQGFIIDSMSNATFTTSLLSIDSDVSEPANLDPAHYFPLQSSSLMFCVGCCNGVVCMAILSRLLDVGIFFWNPALRLSKFVPIPQADSRFFSDAMFSLGFGCDSDGDFRVVKIVFRRLDDFYASEARVYSAKSDTWASIDLTFELRVLSIMNDSLIFNITIVNGNPYWVARIHESDALVWCDMTKLEFKTVPLSGLKLEDVANVPFVNWKGSLAALLYTKSDESLDVWVFDDGEMVWRKNQTFGPIEMNVDRCLQCSKNGLIVGDRVDGTLFVLDPEISRWVKEIEIGEYEKEYLEINVYNESLVCIEGMKQIQVEQKWKTTRTKSATSLSAFCRIISYFMLLF